MFGPTLGLDIGASAVKLCQVAVSGGRLRLTRLGLAQLPPGAVIDGEVIKRPALVSALREALGLAGGWQRKVSLALSGAKSVLVRQITVPLMTDAELAEQISWEAEQFIPFNLNDVQLDYRVVRRRPGEQKMDLLIVAARKDRLAALTEAVREAGLRPVGCDVAANVRARLLLERQGALLGETVALIDVGAGQTTVDLLDFGVSVGHTTVTAGGESITRLIGERLGVPFAEAEALKLGQPSRAPGPYRGVSPGEVVGRCVAAGAEAIGEEIQRSLAILLDRVQPRSLEGIYLTGGAAAHPEIPRTLERLTRAQVALWAPMADLEAAGAVDRELQRRAGLRLSLALGLALGEGPQKSSR